MSINTSTWTKEQWNDARVLASKKNPCPVCGKFDWCTNFPSIGKACCKRVPSDKPARNGGHWHQIGEPVAAYAPPLRRTVARPVRMAPEAWEALQRQFQANVTPSQIKRLAESLGVREIDVCNLGPGWKSDEACYTFPMVNAAGYVIGIQRRWLTGEKKAMAGAELGLFVPTCDHTGATLTIVEGCSDLLAALSIGWKFTIGRPNCSAIVQTILDFVDRSKARQVVIVPDLDENQAGQRGADALQSKLRVPSKQLILPAKDLRQAVQSGYTSRMAENQLRDTMWQMPQQQPPESA